MESQALPGENKVLWPRLGFQFMGWGGRGFSADLLVLSSAGSLKPRSSDISGSATQSLLHEYLSEVGLNLSRTLFQPTSELHQ